MFTGIIEAKAKVLANHITETGQRLIIDLPFSKLTLGESIAVNGVCLTYIGQNAFDVSSETLNKTNLKNLTIDEEVNLERALMSHSRMGGHYVSGHVDTSARVLAFESEGEYVKLNVGGFLTEHMPFLITKGSITLNGVSLTINHVNQTQIELMLVPHTIQQTTFAKLSIQQLLNVEFDYMTRVISHQVQLLLDDKIRCLIKDKFK
jgi:riboflavin synthase